MVEVFKTGVTDPVVAGQILRKLTNAYPNLTINFDLEDEDRILRMEGESIVPETVIFLLHNEGLACIHLPMDMIWILR